MAVMIRDVGTAPFASLLIAQLEQEGIDVERPELVEERGAITDALIDVTFWVGKTTATVALARRSGPRSTKSSQTSRSGS